MAKRKRRLSQFVRVKVLGRGNYAVIFADGFGQVQAYDTHGPVLITALPARPARELRLDDILHRKSFAELAPETRRRR